MSDRVCIRCHNPILVPKNRKYCGPECQKAAMREQICDSVRRSRNTAISTCPSCGKPMGAKLFTCRACHNASKRSDKPQRAPVEAISRVGIFHPVEEDPPMEKSWLKCDFRARVYGRA